MHSRAHPATLPIDDLLEECRILRQRRSGPGGQHRNKVETAVVIEHLPTGTRGEASERRSQEQNRRAALQRLRVQLAVRVRSDVEEDGERVPSARWRARLSGTQLSVSSEHEEFPAILAEALDVAAAKNWDLAQVAVALGASSSQLVKLLKQEPAAIALVNAHRRRLGLVSYK